MTTSLTRLVLAVAIAAGAGIPVAAVTIDWVTVGNPGNAADTTGYGDVSNEFKIAKYEVTIQQYTDFLNAVAASDPYSLYNANMATNLNVAGISRSGSSGSYSYSVIGPNGATPAGAGSPGNRPITYVSWFDAARFANWMQNGQQTGTAGAASTETGAYTLNGATSGTAPAVNAAAQIFIPTEDQWYKPAYYSPLLNSGSGGYYLYATQSNTAPGNTIGGTANQANWRSGSTWTVTQTQSYDANQNYLTDVGAFTASASPYGTFDQNGNVWEWNDLTGTAGSLRGIRGNYWADTNVSALQSSFRLEVGTADESESIGFRLAAVPEPGSLGLAASGVIAAGGLMIRRRRQRM